MASFQVDESPHNRDWSHIEWVLPPYKSRGFDNALAALNMTLSEFKRTPMYAHAVHTGAIVNDTWVPRKNR